MSSYSRNAFTYATIVAMGGFVFGLDAALISGTLNFILKEFALTELQLGVVVGAPAWGVVVALPFAGYISNLLGRKNTLSIIAALYVVSALSSALAPTYFALLTARFLGGLAFSSLTLSSMYIGEIAPAEKRGKLVSMNQINIVVGLSGAYFINYLIINSLDSGAAWVESWGMKENTWRWMLGAEVIPAIAWLLLLQVIPKSPAWLLYKGREEEAEKTLRKVIPETDIPAKIQEMQTSLEESTDDRSVVSQLKEVFSKPFRIACIVALTIAIAQQTTGINAILFYAPMVFEQIGIGTDAAFMQTIWIGLVSLVFTILSLLLIDRIGRRPMILWGMVWIILSLGVCAYGFSEAKYTLTAQSLEEMTDLAEPERLSVLVGKEFRSDIVFKKALQEVIGEKDVREFSGLLLQKTASMNAVLIVLGILSFIAAFHFSVGPIMWVLFSEIFPISIRGIAIPFFALITSLTSVLVQQYFPLQLATMGASSTFLFYAATVTVGLFILYRFLPETKNMTIEEIQTSLQTTHV